MIFFGDTSPSENTRSILKVTIIALGPKWEEGGTIINRFVMHVYFCPLVCLFHQGTDFQSYVRRLSITCVFDIYRCKHHEIAIRISIWIVCISQYVCDFLFLSLLQLFRLFLEKTLVLCSTSILCMVIPWSLFVIICDQHIYWKRRL